MFFVVFPISGWILVRIWRKFHKKRIEYTHSCGARRGLRFLLLTRGTRGDIQPILVIGQKLVELNNHVFICTNREFAPWVIKCGLKYVDSGIDNIEQVGFIDSL